MSGKPTHAFGMGQNARRKRQARMKKNRDGARQNRTGSVRRVDLGTSSFVEFSGPEGEEMMDALRAQLDRFREKFGREPNDDDPLFFDPDCDEPTPLTEEKIEAEMVSAMQMIGVDPALIYAYQQTGLIVTEDNMSLMAQEDLDEHLAAVARYRNLHG